MISENRLSKKEKDVLALSRQINELSPAFKKWVKRQFKGYFTQKRNRNYCLECGGKWDDQKVTRSSVVKCPVCGRHISYTNYKSINEYYGIMTTFRGFQVLRIVLVQKKLRYKEKPLYIINEVIQHWINAAGKVYTLTLDVNPMSYRYDIWIYNSNLSFHTKSQNSNYRYDIDPVKYYPYKKNIPELKRNGYDGNNYNFSYQDFFKLLLGNVQFETLLKTSQYRLLEKFYFDDEISKRWSTIKVCNRHNYIIKDVYMYCDYLDLLEYFNKDLHNPKFVCPFNLKYEHDILMNKKHKIDEKIRINKQILEDKKIINEYNKRIKKYINLKFNVTDEVEIIPLKSVKEFQKEAEYMHHCLFTNRYYSKKDSLILSARNKNNTPIETIEVSLKNKDVIQSRARFNGCSKYHDNIVKCVKENIIKIIK